jgi:DnaJ family protein C protein 2
LIAAASEREKLQAHMSKKDAKENIPTVPTDSNKTIIPAAWTSDQQAALEKALITFPASLFKQNPSSRWEKVAEAVPGKTLSEVKARMKELAELVSKSK